MPVLLIRTNVARDDEETRCLTARASAAVAGFLGKPESAMLAGATTGAALAFGGDDGPAAYVELKSIGLTAAQCPELSRQICDFLAKDLGVPPKRIYIEFSAIDGKMFGSDGRTY